MCYEQAINIYISAWWSELWKFAQFSSLQIVRKPFSICIVYTKDVCSPFRTPFGIFCSLRVPCDACEDGNCAVPWMGWSCRCSPSTEVGRSRDLWLPKHPNWSADVVASRIHLVILQRLVRSTGSSPCRNETELVLVTVQAVLGKHDRSCSRLLLSLFRWSRSLLPRHCNLPQSNV